ncbi:hypothetical protein CYLTODRAFT_488379 [Cylindrobasidium torrendii FP15055 ss-10]|uniref:EthD domain-containing protein n=1 Tax=Cylindrobasidium torrendii FP15055 ss-10 TaxID=1314674 RepID=A0A0D7BKG5_9AGAR|nr:hypothetical protein CYLTODRAFT_488379 [Cylindrobasidium torrendii FP15055 ss-10]
MANITVPSKSERARILVLVKRKEGMSRADFCEYWWKKHSPMMAEFMPEPGLLKFHQMHVHDEINARFSQLGAKTTEQWDGVALMEAASWDDLFKVFSDERAAKARAADEGNFIDPSATLLIPVTNIPFIDN